MKRFLYILAAFFFIILGFTKHQENKRTFQQLYALEGTWVMDGRPGILLFECWKKVNDTLMEGRSYRLKGIDMSPEESVSLKCSAGGIFYIPVVANQNDGKSISFKLTSATENEFVFENPEHDYPKRISYRFKTKNDLWAYTDGGSKDSTKRRYFTYQKIK